MMRQRLLFFILATSLLIGVPSCTSAKTRFAQENGPTLLAHRTKKSKATTIVEKIRYSNNPDSTRVVIDLSRPVSYKVSRHTSSQTVVIKLTNAILGKILKKKPIQSLKGNLIKTVTVRKSGSNKVDIILNYKRLGSHNIIVLKKPDRLVFDFYPPTVPALFDIKTIVIDPGHGGKDPGATSKSGLKEKEVVLDVSKRLKKLLQKRLKKKVIMTRTRDVFISLRKRTEIANKKGADLFISVHVNSSPLRHTKGIEIYLLGRASDEGARATAARENAASDEEAFDFQKMILSDLEREFTLNASLELAHFTNNAIVKNLISKYPTPALGVKRAPFFVLAHTDMPAILAEISFLSNRTEEKRLRSKRYRQHVAEALYKGIEGYIRSLNSGP